MARARALRSATAASCRADAGAADAPQTMPDAAPAPTCTEDPPRSTPAPPLPTTHAEPLVMGVASHVAYYQWPRGGGGRPPRVGAGPGAPQQPADAILRLPNMGAQARHASPRPLVVVGRLLSMADAAEVERLGHVDVAQRAADVRAERDATDAHRPDAPEARRTSNASPAHPTPTCSPFPCPAIRSPRPRATSR